MENYIATDTSIKGCVIIIAPHIMENIKCLTVGKKRTKISSHFHAIAEFSKIIGHDYGDYVLKHKKCGQNIFLWGKK